MVAAYELHANNHCVHCELLMRKIISQHHRLLIGSAMTAVTVAALATGLMLSASGTSEADDPFEGLHLATPFPRPDEQGARSVDDARDEISNIEGLGEAVAAVESGDVARLLDLTRQESLRCADAGRVAPVECLDDPTAVLTVVDHLVGFDRTAARPVEWMASRLHDIVDGDPATLVFASRDGALPAGPGGRYFLVFESPQASDPQGRYNAVGLLVVPGRASPIEAITFITPDHNALEWVQGFAPDDQILIAPESVAGWPGLGDGRSE